SRGKSRQVIGGKSESFLTSRDEGMRCSPGHQPGVFVCAYKFSAEREFSVIANLCHERLADLCVAGEH
ncbi:hypothetical protein, partial [Escherichia coli]|uniref:hypothetical protein n=1 Tax=Escherichia coli TaxID=562 RepID=UPI0019D504A9